jgi:hypothetical protein
MAEGCRGQAGSCINSRLHKRLRQPSKGANALEAKLASVQSNPFLRVCAPPPAPPPPMRSLRVPTTRNVGVRDARLHLCAMPSCASTAELLQMRALGYIFPAGRCRSPPLHTLSPKGRRRELWRISVACVSSSTAWSRLAEGPAPGAPIPPRKVNGCPLACLTDSGIEFTEVPPPKSRPR